MLLTSEGREELGQECWGMPWMLWRGVCMYIYFNMHAVKIRTLTCRILLPNCKSPRWASFMLLSSFLNIQKLDDISSKSTIISGMCARLPFFVCVRGSFFTGVSVYTWGNNFRRLHWSNFFFTGNICGRLIHFRKFYQIFPQQELVCICILWNESWSQTSVKKPVTEKTDSS